MKIWWPWRKTKSVLSLFEERVPPDEGPDARPLRLMSTGPSRLQRHPQNAARPFYAGHGECMACGYPHVLAPDLIGWEFDHRGRHNHCYFKKQPNQPGELKRALDAIAGSCCGALYYSGSDPEVVGALRRGGNAHAIIGPARGQMRTISTVVSSAGGARVPML